MSGQAALWRRLFAMSTRQFVRRSRQPAAIHPNRCGCFVSCVRTTNRRKGRGTPAQTTRSRRTVGIPFSIVCVASMLAGVPVQAGSSYGLNSWDQPVSASASLIVKVVVPSHAAVALSEDGPAAYSNIRGTSRTWSCSVTRVQDTEEPWLPAELAGVSCRVRTVTPKQAGEHGVFRGLTYATP